MCSFCFSRSSTNNCSYCCVCNLENISVASLVPIEKDKWVHRDCLRFKCCIDSNGLVEEKVKKNHLNCQLCWASTGNMIKCLVPNCNTFAHTLCSKISDRVVEVGDIPVSLYNL
jgi:hypothetical protein